MSVTIGSIAAALLGAGFLIASSATDHSWLQTYLTYTDNTTVEPKRTLSHVTLFNTHMRGPSPVPVLPASRCLKSCAHAAWVACASYHTL